MTGRRGGGDDPAPCNDRRVILHSSATGDTWPLQKQDQQAPPRMQPGSPGVRFRSAPAAAGAMPVAGAHRWEAAPPAQPRAQFAELQQMMGTGPILEGVDAAQIQSGTCPLTSREAYQQWQQPSRSNCLCEHIILRALKRV